MGENAIASIEAIREVLRGHNAAEHAADVETTMASVSAHPRWLMHPAYEIVGREAVEELYRRTLPQPGHVELGNETIRAVDDPDITSWGTNHCVIEFGRAPERYPLHQGFVLIVAFDGLAISEERLYLLNEEVARRVVDFFGADFATVPGVTRLR